MSERLLTPLEVAALLRVTEKQARALVRKMEHIDLGAGIVRVSDATLHRFIKSTTCKANSTDERDLCCTGSVTKTKEDSLSSIAPEPSTLQKQRSSLLSLTAPEQLKEVQPRTRPRAAAGRLRKR